MMGRRALLAQLLGTAGMVNRYGGRLNAPANAPGAGAAVPGIQPGTSAIDFARYVIVSGAKTGVFVYSPTPGNGNLKLSMANSGTDPYGNTVQGGFVAYLNSAGTQWISLGGFGADLHFNNSFVTADIELQSGAAGNLALVAGNAIAFGSPISGALFALEPGTTGTNEVWHTLTLGNGWSGTLQYKLMPDDTVAIRTSGTLTAGTLTDGTVIATIPSSPAGYYPATAAQKIEAVITAVGAGSAATGRSPYALVNTSGQILVEGMVTQVPTNVRIDGRYPLD